jgi:hypothetical protein
MASGKYRGWIWRVLLQVALAAGMQAQTFTMLYAFSGYPKDGDEGWEAIRGKPCNCC